MSRSIRHTSNGRNTTVAKSGTPWLAFLVVLTLILAVGSPGLGQTLPTYRLIDVGDLPGGPEESWGYDVNAFGSVVGMSKAPTFAEHPFYWSQDTGIIDMGILPGGIALGEAHGVNDHEQGAGRIAMSTGMRAFLWDADSGMEDLGDLPGGPEVSVAHKVNNLGHVVGHSYVDTEWHMSTAHAYFYTPEAGMIDLGLLPGATQDFSTAEGINDFDEVVGRSSSPSDLNQAFYWSEATGMVGMGTFGGEASYAWDINEAGVAVGAAEFNEGSPSARVTHAFKWTLAGGLEDLGTCPQVGNFSEATGINNHGMVVGFCRYPSYAPIGTLWTQETGWVLLNSLLDSSGAGWYVFEAQAVNDCGQIAATAYTPDSPPFIHAVLLSPNVQKRVGDVDCDRDIDFDDVAIFVDVLLDRSVSPFHIDRADLSDDGIADGADIPLFVEAML